jgi:hypothetical protein
MASAHAFMDLNPAEMGYFIQQVALAATSFGVSTEDVTAVGAALTKLFNYRCSPPTEVIPEMGKTLNSICQNEECPLDAMATCAAYPMNGTVMEPATKSGNGSASGTGMVKPTGTGPAMSPNAAGSIKVALGGLLGALAFVVAL